MANPAAAMPPPKRNCLLDMSILTPPATVLPRIASLLRKAFMLICNNTVRCGTIFHNLFGISVSCANFRPVPLCAPGLTFSLKQQSIYKQIYKQIDYQQGFPKILQEYIVEAMFLFGERDFLFITMNIFGQFFAEESKGWTADPISRSV
jgi:hypothetical protein